MHLEDYMVMYGIYNAETLGKLIYTVHYIHNKTTTNERLFAGELSTAYAWCKKTRNTTLFYKFTIIPQNGKR